MLNFILSVILVIFPAVLNTNQSVTTHRVFQEVILVRFTLVFTANTNFAFPSFLVSEGIAFDKLRVPYVHPGN